MNENKATKGKVYKHRITIIRIPRPNRPRDEPLRVASTCQSRAEGIDTHVAGPRGPSDGRDSHPRAWTRNRSIPCSLHVSSRKPSLRARPRRQAVEAASAGTGPGKHL